MTRRPKPDEPDALARWGEAVVEHLAIRRNLWSSVGDTMIHDDDDPGMGDDFDEEGDCPDCGGTGEVCCNCDDRGCSLCIDGMRTCMGCDGSGFRPRETGDFDR